MGWSNASIEPGFGSAADPASMKTKLINLMTSIRTLMRSKFWISSANGTGAKQSSYSIVPLIAINTVIILYELVLG